ncbi:MAG: hypothetical protein JW954_02335 [Dehalococcoidaceae bacterium]|nr:hypothetical protein [Dehalococcoidaceae bacterium]
MSVTSIELTEWLLQGPPWVEYRTRIDLLGQAQDSPPVARSRRAMLEHPQVKGLLSELADWPGRPILRHNDAGHPLHKLVFIADLGLRADDPKVCTVIERIMQCRSGEGDFQTLANISPRWGGTGNDQPGWMLCDSPSILYSLARLGLHDDPAVLAAAARLADLSQNAGWPCAVAPEFGKFRGPGRKTDLCPYATLITLKALVQLPQWRESQVCINGALALLDLWEERRQRRPFLFAMGTGFTRLKAPFIWYDILHVLEALSQLPVLHKDKRFIEMLEIVKGKSDGSGRFTPESIWKAWSDWDFGQKRVPSYYLTLHVARIFNRTQATTQFS